MRLLILSDSHGAQGALDRALSEQPTARHVFFLGDYVRDIEAVRQFFPDRIFHIVSGNCDGSMAAPATGIEQVAGVSVLYTHGHAFRVKSGTESLLARAKAMDCRIALYGHTHIADIAYADGIYLVNPGSVGKSRNGAESYAVIDVADSGILPAIITC